jgi:hypothetical protein
MPIDEDKLIALIEPKAEVEVLSTISSDGRNLLTRVPRHVVEKTNLKKKHTFRWLVDADTNKINLEIIREENGSSKKDN